MNADVLIVGAGPAGMGTAWGLGRRRAAADVRAIVVEKRHEIGALQRRIVAIVRDILTRLDHQHRMTPRYASAHAMSLLGSLNYTYAWFDPKGPIKPEEYADQVVDVFLHGFLSKES